MSLQVQFVSSYNGDYNENLFLKTYSTWNKTDYSNRIYLQIIRNLKRESVSYSDKLVDKDGKEIREKSMSIPDIFGRYYSSIILKYIVSTEHVYEIRINRGYYKERILFYPSNQEQSIVLTFYFEKQNNKDKTNEFAIETEEIYLGIRNSSKILDN